VLYARPWEIGKQVEQVCCHQVQNTSHYLLKDTSKRPRSLGVMSPRLVERGGRENQAQTAGLPPRFGSASHATTIPIR
jgi:hypothetical protein